MGINELLTKVKLYYKILYCILLLFYKKKNEENCHFNTIQYN